jgi:hypothetical protein
MYMVEQLRKIASRRELVSGKSNSLARQRRKWMIGTCNHAFERRLGLLIERSETPVVFRSCGLLEEANLANTRKIP